VLWMASVLVYLGGGITAVVEYRGLAGIGIGAYCLFMAALAAVMALGLWTVKPWARIAQLVIAGLGCLTCSFTLCSVVPLVYVLRGGVAARFKGVGNGDPKEGLFTGLLLGTVILGVLGVAVGV